MGNRNIEKNGKRRSKKKVLIVLSVILLILIVAVTVIGIKFQSHIRAAVIWLTTSDDDIQKNIDDAKDKQTEVLNNSGFYASKELDEALMSGKITSQEHTQILLGETTLEQVLQKDNYSEEIPPDNPLPSDETQNEEDVSPPVSEKPLSEQTEQTEKTAVSEQPSVAPPQQENVADKNQTPSEPEKQATVTTADVDKRTAELVTRMYVLKSEYTSQVEGIVSAMKAEYSKLPPEERTLSAKRTIATGYLSTINAMEAQCDAQVNVIVTELRQLLRANGRDTALADSILSTYAKEKENTKAYYLSTYGD